MAVMATRHGLALDADAALGRRADQRPDSRARSPPARRHHRDEGPDARRRRRARCTRWPRRAASASSSTRRRCRSRRGARGRELLGIDPLHIANEGKAVLGVRPDAADAVLPRCARIRSARDAAIVGDVHRRAARARSFSTPASAGGCWRSRTASRCRAYADEPLVRFVWRCCARSGRRGCCNCSTTDRTRGACLRNWPASSPARPTSTETTALRERGATVVTHPIGEFYRAAAATSAIYRDSVARRAYDRETARDARRVRADLVILDGYCYLLTTPMLEAFPQSHSQSALQRP